MYFRNYGRPKTWLDKRLKREVWQHPSTSNMVNAPKHISSLKNSKFPGFFWLLEAQLSFKNSLLVIWKLLRLFLNTFTADEKYSVLYREHLTHPIHMQLSQKQKPFSEFFSTFLKSRLNFEHIQKKDDTHS